MSEGWIAHCEALKQLVRSAQTGRAVHALILSGPRGCGKRTAAAFFARASVCTSAVKPCGVCSACKKFDAGTHPDVHRLYPEKGMIRIGPVRELIDALALSPYEAPGHVVLIESADSMNPAAQNALLKTLETPPGDAHFILTAQSESSILPTIRSRCQIARLSLPPVEICTKILAEYGVEPEKCELLAGIACGSVGRALEIWKDDGFLGLRDRVLGALRALNGPESVPDVSAAILQSDGKVKKKKPTQDETNAVLEIMEIWARDLLAVQNGAPPFETSDLEALRTSRLDGRTLLLCVFEARRKLASNVSWPNALDELLLSACA